MTKTKKQIKKVCFGPEERKWYWSEGDLHTDLGIVKQKDMKDGKVRTHLGREIQCLPANFLDQVERIYRGPAIIRNKDVGMILAYCAITPKTKIVDAGAGCGVLAAFLARISNNVTSYENNEAHYAIAKKNAELLGVKYKLKKKDIYQGVDEKKIDVITLDLPEPWRVLPHAEKCMKKGGMLVAFLPHISQVEKLVAEAKKDFLVIKACELIERDWVIEPPRIRPKHQGLMHTAFLVFLRKL